jgi:hypothetical protein
VAKCDQYRFGTGGPDPVAGTDPAPPGARNRPKSANVYSWESVRCYHEVYYEPIINDLIAKVRALTREDTGVGRITDRCAENALNGMFNELSQFVITDGCVGSCTGKPSRACTFNADCGGFGSCTIEPSCQRAVAKCMSVWDAAALQGANDCGTCPLGALDSELQPQCTGTAAPGACPGAQISCATWRAWCDDVLGAIAPVRYGCRSKARPGFE